jgi:hypothetical protein
MPWNDENISPSVTQETDAALVSLGQRGCVCIYEANSATGNFAAVQCLTDVVFVALDTIEGSVADSAFYPLVDNGVTFPAGTIIYGRFTFVEISAGQAVICYKA